MLIFFQQKLHNEQVELTQPDGSLIFEGNLAALPLFGQTFIPRQAGLRGIYLPIAVTADPNQAGGLTLHLRASLEARDDLRTTFLAVADLTDKNLARFSFTPLPDSFNTRYYFFIEPTPGLGEAKIALYYGGPTTYVDGALYLNGEPQESQANFFLAYDRTLILWDWGQWVSKNSGNLLVVVLLTLLPGGVLLLWLWPQELGEEQARLNPIEWLALASGLSVAFYPILFLWAAVVGFRLNRISIIIILVLAGAGILLKGYRYFKSSPGKMSTLTLNGQFLQQTSLSAPILLFWLIFMLSSGVRLLVIRGQDMPLWQDSYHHSMISQLLVDNGGLFTSWTPYAPIESFSYHFGFHTFVAIYHWLIGGSIFQAVLATGQVMNILTVLMAFLLGRRLGGSDWAGTFAALITGLLSEYPMFYVNWGRYTQLTGQVILPGVMILTWLTLKTQNLKISLSILTSLSLAGLFLTHYRVVFFYPGFVLPLLILTWLQVHPSKHQTRSEWGRLLGVGCGSVVLIAPWVWQLIGSKLLWIGKTLTVAGTSNTSVQEIVNIKLTLFDYVPPPILILGLIGVIWGCWQRRPGIFLTAGWGVLLLIMANPHFLGLPGAGLITYFAILIAMYLPFSVLAGFVLAEATHWLLAFRPLTSWGLVLGVLVIALSGTVQQAKLFTPSNAMVTKPDMAAMEWIRKNISPDATFWINARQAYGSTTIVGTDAGWWLSFLTNRKNFFPPMTYASEITEPPDYWAKLLELYQKTLGVNISSIAGWQTLQEMGVTHIYIGQRRGEIWPGPEPTLNPQLLLESPYYQTIYHQDQVWIFALNNE